MKQQPTDAQVIPYPKYLRMSAEAYRTVRHKPMIHGLLEVDVTRARAALREHKAKSGETLSFTAFLATCLGRAVAEHKAVQAFRLGAKRLILFDDVDISTRVEHDVGGQKYVVTHIIRAANRKTMRQIHDEVRAAQQSDVQDRLERFHYLPTMLYRPVAWVFLRIWTSRPRLWKEAMGTVGITSVGMFGQGAGWGIPASAPTALMLTVGGIGEKQVMVGGRPAIREYLSLTISVDHNLVDGAPATRFTRRLQELIESGYGLELDAATADATAELESSLPVQEVSHAHNT